MLKEVDKYATAVKTKNVIIMWGDDFAHTEEDASDQEKISHERGASFENAIHFVNEMKKASDGRYDIKFSTM